jgi:hypothetical protein
MKVKTVILFVLKIAILSVVMFILFSVGTILVGFQSDTTQITSNETETFAEQATAVLTLLIVCLVDVLILTYLILRSRLVGIRLILLVTLVYYGVKTFMSQIESWYFMTNITTEMIPKLFLMTVPTALLFPPIAVFILGKFKKDKLSQNDQNTLLLMSAKEWVWKIALLVVVVYPLLYLVFGYFIAWKNPDVRAFYGGTDPGNFFAHLSNLFRENNWLYMFQLLRGLLWVGIAILVIKSMKGHAWEIGLLVALVFSLLMNDVHLLPNPLMPPSVRLTHFVETASSNFIWGWSIVGLLMWHPKRNI